MEQIINLRRTASGNYEALIHWHGFDISERSWEPIKKLFTNTPSFVVKQLSSLKLSLSTRRALFRRYNINVTSGAGGTFRP